MHASALFFALVPLLAAAVPAPSSSPVPFTAKVTFDNTYDNAAGSLNSVACSNGVNGLVTKFPTFGSLPGFPFIGGANAVAGWNSTNCGTCWALTFNGKTINVTAIDTAGVGFNIAEEALVALGGQQAIQQGSVEASAVQVPSSVCGL